MSAAVRSGRAAAARAALATADLAGPIAPRRPPVAEQVVQRVMGLIRRGRLKPGDRLPSERDLAAALDVSRPSLRESLRALAILGVVDIRHGGGIHVSSLDASELLEPLDFFIGLDPANLISLFEARVHFEPMLAGIAADRIGEEALGRLRRELADQEAAPDDAEVFHDSDIEFHRIVTDACGNPFLSRIAKMLQVLGERGRRVLQPLPSFRHASIRDHAAILDALARRDGEAAAGAMRAHFVRVRDTLVRQMAGPG